MPNTGTPNMVDTVIGPAVHDVVGEGQIIHTECACVVFFVITLSLGRVADDVEMIAPILQQAGVRGLVNGGQQQRLEVGDEAQLARL
ncbi:MAG: hypothetical protein ACTSV1_05725 [Alphaproteobacteria bacterium]